MFCDNIADDGGKVRSDPGLGFCHVTVVGVADHGELPGLRISRLKHEEHNTGKCKQENKRIFFIDFHSKTPSIVVYGP